MTLSISLESPYRPLLVTESSPSPHLQGKRVRFKTDSNLVTYRFFYENQPIDQFLTSSPYKRKFQSASSEEDFFRCAGPDNLLNQKEKRVFSGLSDLFFPPSIFSLEEFREEFSKLFFPPYFQLHLNHMIRELNGTNEIDFDLKDVIRGFVPFMTSHLGLKDDIPTLKQETLMWIESMLNAPIYKEGQALLQANLDEILVFYQKSHARIEEILNPSACEKSSSYKTSADFWIHFLSLYPQKRIPLELVIQPEHPIFHVVDFELGEIIKAGGMWKDFCDTLVEDSAKILTENGFLVALIESPNQIMMKTLDSVVMQHPLVKLWAVEESVENLSLLEPGISRSGFNSIFLTSLMRSRNTLLTPLKVKIIFEYAILHLKNSTRTTTSEDYLRMIFDGLRAFPLTDRFQNPFFSIKGALWQLFHNPSPLRPILEKRFWHSLYTKSEEAKELPDLKDQLIKAGRNQ